MAAKLALFVDRNGVGLLLLSAKREKTGCVRAAAAKLGGVCKGDRKISGCGTGCGLLRHAEGVNMLSRTKFRNKLLARCRDMATVFLWADRPIRQIAGVDPLNSRPMQKNLIYVSFGNRHFFRGWISFVSRISFPPSARLRPIAPYHARLATARHPRALRHAPPVARNSVSRADDPAPACRAG